MGQSGTVHARDCPPGACTLGLITRLIIARFATMVGLQLLHAAQDPRWVPTMGCGQENM